MSENKTRKKMKKLFILAFSIILGIGFLFVDTALAVANPEVIQWRVQQNAVFLNSLFQGVLGRNPSQNEFNFYINRNLSKNMGRGEAFWSLIGQPEYKTLFGTGQGPYQIRWKHKQRDTDRGRVWCRCYFFTKDPSLTGGQTAVMQYIGVRTPWSSYSYSVARAVTRMYAVYDSDVCPYLECGLNRNDLAGLSAGNSGSPGQNNNLVRDTNFANFNSGQAWGTGLYSQNGIWWNSNNARSRYSIVNLNQSRPPGSNAVTALYLQNSSGSAPHVYGTTCQRINVQRGRRYTISFWATARNLASNGTVYIVVDPQWRVRPINMKGGSFGWTKFSGSFTASSNYIDLRIIIANTGEVWITEMTMTPQ